MLYGIYRVLTTTLFIVLTPFLLAVGLLNREFGTQLAQRLSFYPAVAQLSGSKRRKKIWLHAASVGEVQAAKALIAELAAARTDIDYVITTMTATGQHVARGQLPPRVTCLLAPLDIAFVVRRALKKIAPDLYVCLETELWPAMLREADRAGIKMILLNGRMSERSFRRYHRLRSAMAPLLAGYRAIGVIHDHDALRFRALGAADSIIHVTGNIKYDVRVTGERELARQSYRTLLGLSDEIVFLCGSTREGEEELLLQVFLRLRRESNRKIVWLVAPRHLERLPQIELLFRSHNLPHERFSALANHPRQHDVVLIDCLGKLADLYGVGDFNFCGGSLVQRGGHNLMEPIHWGKPVYFGPHMDDFRDAVALLQPAGAGFQVRDAQELAALILDHVGNTTKYAEACRAACGIALNHKGAAGRQADMVLRLLAG